MSSFGATWKQTPAAVRILWIVGVLAIALGWLLDWRDTWEPLAGAIGPLGILAVFIGVFIDARKRPRP